MKCGTDNFTDQLFGQFEWWLKGQRRRDCILGINWPNVAKNERWRRGKSDGEDSADERTNPRTISDEKEAVQATLYPVERIWRIAIRSWILD